MHQPTMSHRVALKRLLGYLHHAATFGLRASREPDRRLIAYPDSDWAGPDNPVDLTSTIGYVVYLDAIPISWSSETQHSVSRSSTEAEYRAIADAVSETNWLTTLLSELRFSISGIPKVLCDDVGTTYICANPVFHSQIKHVAIDFHFVQEQAENGLLQVSHLHTADQA